MEPAGFPSNGPQAQRPRGVSVGAVLIVLLIIAIAAMAVQVARQRHGGVSWTAVGSAPGAALPRCLWPSDHAYVQGSVDVYSGLPGFAESCSSQAIGSAGAPLRDTAAAALLTSNAGAINAACSSSGPGPENLWYLGRGTYSCRGSAHGRGSKSGFASASLPQIPPLCYTQHTCGLRRPPAAPPANVNPFPGAGGDPRETEGFASVAPPPWDTTQIEAEGEGDALEVIGFSPSEHFAGGAPRTTDLIWPMGLASMVEHPADVLRFTDVSGAVDPVLVGIGPEHYDQRRRRQGRFRPDKGDSFISGAAPCIDEEFPLGGSWLPDFPLHSVNPPRDRRLGGSWLSAMPQRSGSGYWLPDFPLQTTPGATTSLGGELWPPDKHREAFSPDMPGTCAYAQKHRRAGDIELAAMRVLAGSEP